MKYIPHLKYIREKNCNLGLSEKKISLFKPNYDQETKIEVQVLNPLMRFRAYAIHTTNKFYVTIFIIIVKYKTLQTRNPVLDCKKVKTT